MAKRFNSRAKGNGYERKIAKKLCKAWGFPIVRTPNSGAFKRLAPSDIIPEDRQIWIDWPFFIECKSRQGWNLEQLLTDKKCPVMDWYLEEEKKQVDAVGEKFYEKCLLLIFTKRYDDSYVMFRNDHRSFPLIASWKNTYHKNLLLLTSKDGSDYYIMSLTTFLEGLDFNRCQQQYKEWLNGRQT